MLHYYALLILTDIRLDVDLCGVADAAGNTIRPGPTADTETGVR